MTPNASPSTNEGRKMGAPPVPPPTHLNAVGLKPTAPPPPPPPTGSKPAPKAPHPMSKPPPPPAPAVSNQPPARPPMRAQSFNQVNN